MEAVIARGPSSEYGLLAVTFEANGEGLVDIKVPFGEMHGARWDSALAAAVDDVRLGLPTEYAGAVLSALSSEATKRFPTGTLRISRAAHGLVGSSQNFFGRMLHAMMALGLMQQSGIEQEALVSGLRDVLVHGSKIR